MLPAMRDDLAWWWIILHDPALNGIPLEYFNDLPAPDFTVVTDASDVGLCALVPALKQALSYQFQPPSAPSSQSSNAPQRVRHQLPRTPRLRLRGQRLGPTVALQPDLRTPITRAFPHRQYIGGLMAIPHGVTQLPRSTVDPPYQSLGTPIRPSFVRHSYPRSREHDGRRRIAPVAEHLTRNTFSGRHSRVDSRDTLVQHVRLGTGLAQHLREHSVAESSFKLYSRAFTTWKRWSCHRGIPWQLNLPTDEKVRVISEFIIDGAQHGFASRGPAQSSTIKSTLCGIRHFFTATGRDFPVGHPQIRMLLKGVKRFDLPR
ncbi:LOW QUALITY PROTEIN: hypothetical protein PHMEG_00038398 [Phytophthora megakarya]|uniref:Uncharacterized protein n=1 Tax=Phytophthora megakarya TaxID=4795 RepID=A0A225UH83_9STRA|nr:LOW QUALITY PROTEIN: hypothetical protein PHMEG_00038398 [Phytophthora megakarya]